MYWPSTCRFLHVLVPLARGISAVGIPRILGELSTEHDAMGGGSEFGVVGVRVRRRIRRRVGRIIHDPPGNSYEWCSRASPPTVIPVVQHTTPHHPPPHLASVEHRSIVVAPRGAAEGLPAASSSSRRAPERLPSPAAERLRPSAASAAIPSPHRRRSERLPIQDVQLLERTTTPDAVPDAVAGRGW